MEDYQVAEEALDNYDDDVEYKESMQDQLDQNFPQQKEQQNQFSWFWKVVQRRDSTKVANLNNVELGGFLMPVREAKRFAHLCGMFEQPILEEFFIGEAENTLATSMSKKGWFVETSISQKKFTSRARESNILAGQQGKPKWKMFSRQNEQASGA